MQEEIDWNKSIPEKPPFIGDEQIVRELPEYVIESNVEAGLSPGRLRAMIYTGSLVAGTILTAKFIPGAYELITKKPVDYFIPMLALSGLWIAANEARIHTRQQG